MTRQPDDRERSARADALEDLFPEGVAARTPREAPRETLEQGPAAAPTGSTEAEQQAWLAFVARCQELAGEDACTRDSAGLQERILARTTREDLSWRGDWRLLAGFVRERLERSLLLRVAAASLLIHLVAAPVVAWMLWRDAPARPHFWTAIERPAPLIDELEPEPEPQPGLGSELGSQPADLWVDAQQVEIDRAVEDALRMDRFHLQTASLPRAEQSVFEDAALELLRMRSLQAASARAGSRSGSLEGDPGGPDVRLARPAPGDALAEVLWVEFELDRHALEGRARDAGLQDGFEQLLVTWSSQQADPVGAAVEDLRAQAVARARAYGLLPADGYSAGDLRSATLARGADTSLRAAFADRGLGEHALVHAWSAR